MLPDIISRYVKGGGIERKVEFERVKQCPICQTNMPSAFVFSSLIPVGNNKYRFYAVYECEMCQSAFISIYNEEFMDASAVYRKHKEYPLKEQLHVFEDEIQKISPSFVKFYQQSERAEQIGLVDICGMGYRKALEFLIKDYLIMIDPSSKEKIESESLYDSMQRIDEPKIKQAATNSRRLGNDQTHYKNLYDDKGIDDLKKFIQTTVYWILMNEYAKQTV